MFQSRWLCISRFDFRYVLETWFMLVRSSVVVSSSWVLAELMSFNTLWFSFRITLRADVVITFCSTLGSWFALFVVAKIATNYSLSVPFSIESDPLRLRSLTCSDFAFRGNPKSQMLLTQNHTIRHVSQWNLGSNTCPCPLLMNSPLCALNPYFDEDELIHIRGRACLPQATKNPIVLRAHPLLICIIQYHYLRTMHAGAQLMLASLRNEFWIL